MSRVGSFAKSFVILGIGNILPNIAGFVVLPVLTGCLSTEEYGTYDLIITIVSLLMPLSTLQIQNAVFRYLIDSRDNEKSIRCIVSSALAFAIGFSVIVLVGYMLVTKDLDAFIRFWICIYYISQVFVVVFRQIARGLGLNKTYTFSSGMQALMQIGLCFLFVLGLGMGLLGSVIMVAGSTLIACLALFLKLRLWHILSFKCIDSACIRKLLHYSWPLVPNQLSMWGMRASNRLVITAICGVTANAMFAAAFKIPQILSLAQGTFQMAWQENATMVSSDSDSDDYYSAMFSMLFGLTAGIASLTIAATPLLFMILIRGEYADAYCQIPLLIVAMFFSSLISFYDGICVACELTTVIGFTALAGAVLNLVLCLALIPLIGITGASIAMLISYALLFLYRAHSASRYVAVKYEKVKLVVSIVLIAAQCFICMQQVLYLNILNAFLSVLCFFLLNKKTICLVASKVKSRFAKC